MAKPRTYPRTKHEGKEYLLLIDDDTLPELNLRWALTAKDIKDFYARYHEYTHVAKEWFYIETGIELTLIPKEQGWAWAIDDDTELSTKYIWLQRKARKFERKIVERLNAYGESVAMALERISESLEEDTSGN